MRRKDSSITFRELTEPLAYIKIIYNGKIIYDDEVGNETREHYEQMKEEYKNKIIYEMNIKITQFHHCILKIKGE